MKTLQIYLKDIRAYKEVVDWASDKTIEEIVKECHRGDWLLWLSARIVVDEKLFFIAKGHCALTVKHLMKDQRSIDACYAAIAYGEGKITKEELKVFADAADAASATAFAAYAAAYATNAANKSAACAASYAADSAYAASAASSASVAASAASVAASAADYAASFTADANKLQTANICRQYLGEEIILKINEILNH